MKVSYKAVLLSGLVFPGAGYLTMKQYRRAAVCITLASIFFVGVVQSIMIKTQSLLDLLMAGKVNPDVPSMLLALQDISNMSLGWQDYAGYGFVVCWLVSVMEAFYDTKKQAQSVKVGASKI